MTRSQFLARILLVAIVATIAMWAVSGLLLALAFSPSTSGAPV